MRSLCLVNEKHARTFIIRNGNANGNGNGTGNDRVVCISLS